MVMRFGIWNVMGPYKAGSLKTVTSELENYKLDLMAIQEVRWGKVCSQLEDDYTFFLWQWKC
jgi:hypothetical protein